MSNIIAIGTALPKHKHHQQDILNFMQQVYALDSTEDRKLKYLYHHSGISSRYSVVGDYSQPLHSWKFYPHTEALEPFPSLELRMAWYQKHAAPLAVDAIRDCLNDTFSAHQITHLITVSCTGMSAPGIDLQVMELMDLPKNIFRTSINFMGCYAAIHALRLADAICKATHHSKVMIVCVELCTLHFQKDPTADNIASSLLFADGAAAVLVSHTPVQGALGINNFYSEVLPAGKKDMSWELSSNGFLMTLSGYVPDLIKQDFLPLVKRATTFFGITSLSALDWCIHPGGKRILEAIAQTVPMQPDALNHSYQVLNQYGNMSSATILFVLKEMMKEQHERPRSIFSAAFGPGLTMETMLLNSVAL